MYHSFVCLDFEQQQMLTLCKNQQAEQTCLKRNNHC